MKKSVILFVALMLVLGYLLAEPISAVEIKKLSEEEITKLNEPQVTVPYDENADRATGDDCSDPIIISLPGDLPYSDLGQTTCGRGNNYVDTDLGYYDGGEDIIYRLDISAEVTIDINLVSTTSWIGMGLFDSCPDVVGSLIASSNGSGNRSILAQNLASGTYYLMMDTWPTPDCIPTFDLSIITTPAGPDNDECTGAIAIGEVVDYAFDTSSATTSGVGPAMNQDLWYVYTASASGQIDVDLCGSSFDTKLAIWESCGAADFIAYNDDSCGAQSAITGVEVTAGSSYYIQVAGYGSNSGAGDITLEYFPPQGSDCSNPFIASLGTNSAPQQPVWYSYTATADGTLTASSVGLTTVDTELYIYSDCIPTEIDHNDDFVGLQSEVTWDCYTGETYYINWTDHWDTSAFDWSLTYDAGAEPITSFPWYEDFESNSYGPNIFTITNDYSGAYISPTAANSSSYGALMEGGYSSIGWTGGTTSTTETNAWVDNVSHIAETSFEVDATGIRTYLFLQFDLKQTYSYGPLYSWFRVVVDGIQMGPSYNPTTANTDPFQTINLDLSSYVGSIFTVSLQHSGKYNAAFTAPGDNSFIDNLSLTTPTDPVFTISPPDYDFGTVILGEFASNSFTISNTGVGTLTINHSDISLTGANVDQFSLINSNPDPIELTAGQSAGIEVEYTPTFNGNASANIAIEDNMARVVNNVPLSGKGLDTSIFTDIGDGTLTNQSLPMEPFYGYSYSQVIYPQNMIWAEGQINALTYYTYSPSGFSVDVVIYMAHTTKSEFESSSDWIDITEFTEVYNGPITIPSGVGEVLIGLDTPFIYNNTDNLVVAFDENTSGYSSSLDEFYCTPMPGVNGIVYYDDYTNPDPSSPPIANYTRNAIANLTLIGIEPPHGFISGTITETEYSRNPIEGALVSVSTAYGQNSAETDANGDYYMKVWVNPNGSSTSATVTCEADGYLLSEPQNIVVFEGEESILNISLDKYLNVPTNLSAIAGDDVVDLTWNGPPVPADLLWDQIDPMGSTSGKSAQDFVSSVNDIYDAEVAGDFVLDQDATITGAAFGFFYNPASTGTPVEFNVSIYPDMGGYPGETPIATTQTTFAVPDGIVHEVSFTTAIPLTAGTYWIGYNMILNFGVYGQCYAYQRDNLDNSTGGYWRNPGGGFGSYTTWAQDINSGDPDYLPQDLTFQIWGNLGSTRQLHISQTELRKEKVTESIVEKPVVMPSSTAANDINLNATFTLSSGANRPPTGTYNIYRGTNPESMSLIASVSDEFYTDNSVSNETKYYYAVTAEYDEGPYESTYSNIVSAHPQYARTIPYFEDFESDNGSYNAFGSTNIWEWGPLGSRIPDGSKVWATNLDGNYEDNGDDWLISVPFDLSSQSAVVLNFEDWFSFESGWDNGDLWIDENNDGIFEFLMSFDGSSGDWIHESIMLPSIFYTDFVKLGFHFFSDSSVNGYDGWYVDDVELSDPFTPITFAEDTTLPVDYSLYLGGDLDITVTPSANIAGTVDSATVTYYSIIENWFGTSTVHLLINDAVTRETLYDADIEVIVTPVNDAPVLDLPETFSFDEDLSLVVNFETEGYLSDPDGDALTLNSAGNTNISLVIDGFEVTFTNTPENWNGSQEVQFFVNDGQSRTSVNDVVMVEVIPVNDEPVVENPLEDIEVPEDFGTYTFGDLTTVFFDPDSQLEYTLVNSDTSKVIAEIVNNEIVLTSLDNVYTTTPVILTITASEIVTRGLRLDHKLLSAANSNSRAVAVDEIEVTITSVNDVPTIVLPDNFVVAEEDSIIVDFTPFVSDIDGDDLTITANPASHISITVDGMNVTIASRILDWVGSELITFNVDDGSSRAISSDNVIVQVTNVNDAPEITLPDTFEFNEGGSLTTNFAQYLNDVDGDALVLSASGNTFVTVAINNLSVTFATADPLDFGTDNVTFEVSDQEGRLIDSDNVDVIVNYVNHPPVYIGPDYVNQLEDFGTYTIGDLDDMFTDVDPPENTNFTFELVSFDTNKINAVIDSVNNLIIESIQDQFGLSTLRIRARDNDNFVTRVSQSIVQDIQIDITPVNDPPLLFDLPEVIEMASNDNFLLNLANNWSDVDDPTPVMTVTSPEGFVTVTKLTGYNYRFRLNSAGLSDVQDYITVTIDDGHMRDAVSQDILVTITASQPPYITFLIPNLEYLEDFELTEVVDLDQCFADPENDPLTFAVQVLTEEGEVPVIDAQIDENNILWLGSMIENWNGIAQIKIDCADFVDRIIVSQNIDVYVESVNDAPIVVQEIPAQLVDEDFADYIVVDLDDVFGDVDSGPLQYQFDIQNHIVDTYYNPVTNELTLQSENDLWGLDLVTVTAWDIPGGNPLLTVSTSFMVTVNSVYDYPEFEQYHSGGQGADLDGLTFDINVGGTTLVLDEFINDHGEDNVIPLGFELVGDIPYYEVMNTEGELWSLDVYPIGHQWAYPDQDCILTLQSTDRAVYSVTVTFGTNFSPYATGEIEDRVLTRGESDTIVMSDYFADPEDDHISYSIVCDEAYFHYVRGFDINGDVFLFLDVLTDDYVYGIHDITVVAQDGTGSCSQSFSVDIPGGVFFSEYIDGGTDPEGPYYNKALEIVNLRNETINLDNYRIPYTTDGNTGWEYWWYFPAGAELEQSDVYVIANPDIDVTLVDVSVVDLFVEPYFVAGFNGNDARGLERNAAGSWVLLDVIGEVGNSAFWDVAGVPSGLIGHTLLRKPGIVNGTWDWAVSAGTDHEDSQWMVLPVVTFEYLGFFGDPEVAMLTGAEQQFDFDTREFDDPEDTPVFVTELGRNVPNPFNPETNIYFSLAEAAEVELTIYNIKGQVIRNLASGTFGMGEHSVRWDGKDDAGQAVSSGVYFYKITTGSYNSMKKMILMK